MLYYCRIDIGEETDVAKCNNSKKRIVCYYWYFNHGFKFQKSAFNGCNGLLILLLSLKVIKSFDYRRVIYDISKSYPIDLLLNSVLDDRGYL